jgi:rubrerythrin
MREFRSVEEILDYAIEREGEAFAFYTDLSNSVKSTYMRQLFSDFAHDELGHKAKLLAIKNSEALFLSERKIMDLKIADYLVEAEPQTEMSYQDALRLAMQREKKSFKFYNDLSRATEDEGTRNIFKFLAQEETKHKLHFEIEYDENVLNED